MRTDDDLLIALGAKTTLDGGDGNDILIGGKGADVLIGGLGTDTADYSKSDADLTTGRGSGGDAEGDRLLSIENVVGSAHDDVLKGDRDNNVMTGGDGADVFVMMTGKDTITDFKPTVDTVIDFNDILVDRLVLVPAVYDGRNWIDFVIVLGSTVVELIPKNVGIGPLVLAIVTGEITPRLPPRERTSP